MHDGMGSTNLGNGPTLQDRPRPGGFPKYRYARNVPARGPHGALIFAGGIGVMLVGFSFVISGRHSRARLLEEKTNARLAISPFLTAEADRRTIRLQHQNLKAEEAIMSNVEGWKVGESVYHTQDYVMPLIAVNIGDAV